MANALLDVPGTVKKGEVFTVKLVLSHIMETGYRRDISGKAIPRNIVRWFTCSYGGAEVFRAEFTQAVAANPFIAFTTIATASGPMRFAWEDDEGVTYAEEIALTVTG